MWYSLVQQHREARVGTGDLARAAMRQEEIVLEERIGPEILPSESVGPGDCEPGIPYGVGR